MFLNDRAQRVCLLVIPFLLVCLLRRGRFQVDVSHSQTDERLGHVEEDGSEEDGLQAFLVRDNGGCPEVRGESPDGR